MADRLDLSEDAGKLLRLHFTGRPLSMRRSRLESLPGRSLEQTRQAYREVVATGLIEPVSTFAAVPEALYRLNQAVDHRRDERQLQPTLWITRTRP
jgi:hypothetical protein